VVGGTQVRLCKFEFPAGLMRGDEQRASRIGFGAFLRCVQKGAVL
jgi:hypothetical protein